MNLIGKQYLVEFGMAKAILTLESDSLLTFTIIQKDGQAENLTESVAVKMTEIRPQVFMATWQEANGNTVTQVQDYERGTIYSNWTLPNGEFKNLTGTLRLLE